MGGGLGGEEFEGVEGLAVEDDQEGPVLLGEGGSLIQFEESTSLLLVGLFKLIFNIFEFGDQLISNFDLPISDTLNSLEKISLAALCTMLVPFRSAERAFLKPRAGVKLLEDY